MSVDNASELITVQNLQVNGSLSFAGSDGFMMDGEDVNNSNVITEFLQVNHTPTDYIGGNNFSNAHVLIGEADSGIALDRREITSKGIPNGTVTVTSAPPKEEATRTYPFHDNSMN